jgi:hypothetical protein
MLISSSSRGPLALETRRRTTIANELNLSAMHDGARLQIAEFKLKYVKVRHRDVGPCWTYNCHGLTFAARRTLIHESSEVEKILREDGYIEVGWADISPGDIAIYRTGVLAGAMIDHSGIVVQRDLPINGILPEPLILSKWGHCHEAIHRARDCPYSDGYSITYYRIVN